ncbi:DUF2207 domain-containing protein [Microbacterium album]|uniref:DUF2207 domain-containing protein n=1 Tax=Microbacterium album TaxID=2053191 RepID=A0A917IH58_9MICO|nr:DUF2207 domain-containing protein [Microbacterium album]GGH46120.1 hypothetical protein GCM10010921_21980 [Microbacterium album]
MTGRDGTGGSPEDPPGGAIRLEQRRPTPLYRRLSAWLLRTEARARARGSRRSRLLAAATWAVVAAIGVLLLVGPVINEPRGFEDYLDAARTGAETWIARDFHADYTVAQDDDGRLRVDVEERIDVHIPEGVEERRIERVVLGQYEGHDVRPELVSAELDGTAVRAGVDRGATRVEFAVQSDDALTGEHRVVLRYVLHDLAYDAFDESTRQWTQALDWDAFGPDWAHGTASASVTITLPRALADASARQPRGGIAWLLVSDSTALTPDDETATTVTYAMSNDQRLPPHSQFWFRFHFEPGTIAMPAPSPLYWVMVVGPFVPLLLAGVALLLALAARAVAWGDARGRAWYVPQSAPQRDVGPELAARVWRAVGTAPLVRALAAYRGGAGAGTRARRDLVRETHRAGRLGNWPRAWTEYLRAPAWREQFSRRLRRVPRGYVRDNFIGASLALPTLQLGLARQLSHQFPLSVYWWPVAVVALAFLLAGAVLVLALSARPLTRPGAFVREHLLGLRLFVEQTSVADRGTLRDPLLPYAVMFSRPRRAAAIVRRALDDAGVPRDVRADPDFLGGGRLAVRTGSVLLVVAAFLLATLVASPTVRPPDDAVWGDLPGSYGMFVREFEAAAVVGRDADGGLVLEVEERLAVAVADGTRHVPQVMRQWTDRPTGKDLALTVTSVSIDGAEVPFQTERLQGKMLLRTTLADGWAGEHDVVVSYRLEAPVSTVWADGAWRDELRWSALDPGWGWGWDGLLDLGGESVEVERVAASLTLPRELAEAADEAGALDHRPGEEASVRPADAVDSAGDTVTYRMEPDPGDDHRHVGFRLLLPEGAVAEPDRVPWLLWAGWRITPFVLMGVLVAAVLAPAAIGIARGRRLRRGLARDLARGLAPAAAAAQLPVFVWMTADWSGDEPAFAVFGLLFLGSVAAAIWSLVATRTRAEGASGRRAAGP